VSASSDAAAISDLAAMSDLAANSALVSEVPGIDSEVASVSEVAERSDLAVVPDRPLRVAALVKQIPVAEEIRLGPDRRLVRDGIKLELNAYCRRAVSKGVELARMSGGTCTVLTLGPPAAEDVLREAVAWGADEGIHLCDPAFAGSDTLATARALAAALRRAGPFDLVLAGRNTLDGETGQVGPEVAELLDLPFASGVRRLDLISPGTTLHLELELDDGSAEVELDVPAVLTVAERLCEPCKVDPEGRAAVDPQRLQRMTASDLGPGPWGDEGSPTRVGATRVLAHVRQPMVLDGPLAEQVDAAVAILRERGALGAHRDDREDHAAADGALGSQRSDGTDGMDGMDRSDGTNGSRRMAGAADTKVIAILAEPGRPGIGAELAAESERISGRVGATIEVLCPDGSDTPLGADQVVRLRGSAVAEDVAAAVASYVTEERPWAFLAPSTAFGREVAGRAAAATGSGLVGDAVALSVLGGRLVAAKPAFSGSLVADITCPQGTQMATVRPGVMMPKTSGLRAAGAPSRIREVTKRGRVRVLNERRNDELETLARAQTVIGVGTGVHPDEYELLSPLAALLGAELAVTRKVTDKGWAPRARQVGVTGRSIAPRLYVALGLSGKFNHMAGVRSAETILAVNTDRDAPVFAHCDVGVVGDWHEVLPLLAASIRSFAVSESGLATA
jgi:electron transfer flavoprotein alpha subunit